MSRTCTDTSPSPPPPTDLPPIKQPGKDTRPRPPAQPAAGARAAASAPGPAPAPTLPPIRQPGDDVRNNPPAPVPQQPRVPLPQS